MHKRWLDFWIVFTASVLIPMLIFLISSGTGKVNTNTEETTESVTLGETVPESTEKAVTVISVLNQNGEIVDMPLNTYVLGVVLAEMPADFEADALKAQAVVARTYALKRQFGSNKHSASVCMNADCCQGYLSEQDYLNGYGTMEDLKKVQSAVDDTLDLVLVFNGALIEATYFSCSGGLTEDAVSVWGQDIPYLQSVKSPGEENATHYTDTISMSLDTFREKLGLQTTASPHNWIGNISYTQGGGVDSMVIAGSVYDGTFIRSALGLRSTAFSMTIIGNTVVITTKGFGHRVGMSQYGAEAMAVAGKSFDEILRYYYQGTELMMYGGND